MNGRSKGNLISIVLALCFVAAVAALIYRQHQSSDPASEIRPTIAPLRNIDWSQYPVTLVFAVRPGCPWCKASMPFYRDVLAASTSTNIHFMVLASVSVPETREYLSHSKLPIEDVRQSDLPTLGIEGTPTLLLVDRKGKLKHYWIGKLSSSGEREVLSELRLSLTVNSNSLKGG